MCFYHRVQKGVWHCPGIEVKVAVSHYVIKTLVLW